MSTEGFHVNQMVRAALVCAVGFASFLMTDALNGIRKGQDATTAAIGTMTDRLTRIETSTQYAAGDQLRQDTTINRLDVEVRDLRGRVNLLEDRSGPRRVRSHPDEMGAAGGSPAGAP